MNISKKFDRAFQWAGEKMGAEAKTSMPEDFKMLEAEMTLRHDGMDRLQKSMTAYVKWVGRRSEVFDDREKGLPISYLGRTMTSHGEDFEPDSEFGNCLVNLGRANERLAAAQEQYVTDATAAWLESLERNLAMMKEYQAARKKLENRRLAYDASISKIQKAKREDFRIEEELRTNRAKYEESSEDVLRRMQDIKDAEGDSIRDLSGFLDCELEYHERCAEELRRVKRSWPAGGASSSGLAVGGRSRSNTVQSYNQRTAAYGGKGYVDEEPEPPPPVRMPIRSNSRIGSTSPPSEKTSRRGVSRINTYQSSGSTGASYGDRGAGGGSGASTPMTAYGSGGNGSGSSNPASTAAAAVSSLRNGLRPVNRIQTNSYGNTSNVFADDGDDTASGGSGGRSGSPDWCERSASPATSFGSLSRSTSNVAMRKPPPPPPTRSKKPPPPPVPARREINY